MSGKNVGAKHLSMNVAVIPPGGVAGAHIHDGFEVMLYILEGRVRHEYGERPRAAGRSRGRRLHLHRAGRAARGLQPEPDRAGRRRRRAIERRTSGTASFPTIRRAAFVEAGTRNRTTAGIAIRLPRAIRESGRTGMKVSRICLGMMTYGDPAWRHGSSRGTGPPHHPARDRARHQLLRHGRHVLARCLGRDHRTRHQGLRRTRRRGHRDESVQPDGAWSERRGTVAQAHPVGDRCVAAAAGHGLRRPVSDSPLGPRHADRRNLSRAQRHRARRKGALYRRVEHGGLAVRKALALVGSSRVDAVRVDAEPLQPGLPRGRARDAAALPGRRHRCHPVESARPRLSRRQPQRLRPYSGAWGPTPTPSRSPTSRLAGAAGASKRDRPPARRGTRSPTTSTTPTRISGSSSVWSRLRASAASSQRRSRWRGSFASRWSRRSSAPRRWSTWTMRWRRSRSACRTTRCGGSKKATSRTR